MKSKKWLLFFLPLVLLLGIPVIKVIGNFNAPLADIIFTLYAPLCAMCIMFSGIAALLYYGVYKRYKTMKKLVCPYCKLLVSQRSFNMDAKFARICNCTHCGREIRFDPDDRTFVKEEERL